jgi:hypothetical protein
MPENAPEPDAQLPERPADRERRRWVLAGVIVFGLIALGAIGLAISAVVACSDGKCMWGHWQHVLAVLGTLTAALASVTQGKTAKTKSDHHLGSWRTETDKKLKSAHAYDFHHFKTVKFWWYIFFAGAVAAVVAEFIDWSGVAGP